VAQIKIIFQSGVSYCGQTMYRLTVTV